MGALPANARIFAADATAMYTNIEPATGIAAVQSWVKDFEHESPKGVPSRLVIHALEMVMTHNTFQFNNTLWQHFVGITTDTPCACACACAGIYATVAYGYHERTSIIPKQNKETMPYLKRFIDDLISICCGSVVDLEVFRASLNDFGKLEWTCSERLTSVKFLNLTIEIDASSSKSRRKPIRSPQT
jgi:hypothetical protein